MRIRLLAATALLPVLAACGGGSSGGGSTVDSSGAAGGGVAASCVAPTLTITPARFQAGEKVHVSGEWFADGCNDMAIDGQPPQAPPPFTDMTIELHQGGQTWPVAEDVDAAGDHYAFDVSVTIPDDVAPGKATMQAKNHGFATDVEVVAE